MASECLLKAHEETLSRYSPSSFTSPWSSQLSYRSGLSDNPGLSEKPTTLISLGIQQATLIHEAILMWWPDFLCFPVVPKKKKSESMQTHVCERNNCRDFMCMTTRHATAT